MSTVDGVGIPIHRSTRREIQDERGCKVYDHREDRFCDSLRVFLSRGSPCNDADFSSNRDPTSGRDLELGEGESRLHDSKQGGDAANKVQIRISHG